MENLEVLPDVLKGGGPLGAQLVECFPRQVLCGVLLGSLHGHGLKEAVGPLPTRRFFESQEALRSESARDQLQVAKSLGSGRAVIGGRSQWRGNGEGPDARPLVKESQFLAGRESLLQDLASQLGSRIPLGKGLRPSIDELCHWHHKSRVSLSYSRVEERAVLDPLRAGRRLGPGGSRRGCQRVSRWALQAEAHSTPGYVVAANSCG